MVQRLGGGPDVCQQCAEKNWYKVFHQLINLSCMHFGPPVGRAIRLNQFLDGSAGRNGDGTTAGVREMGRQIDAEVLVDRRH